MSACALISRLARCKQTGATSWIACCPAHDDRSPSLTIAEAADGRILIHCFAGCAAHEVLAACGLGFDALFPERLPLIRDRHYEPRRLRFNPRDVLRAVCHELLICEIYLHDKKEGRDPTDEDARRFTLAVARVEEARRYANA